MFASSKNVRQQVYMVVYGEANKLRQKTFYQDIK